MTRSVHILAMVGAFASCDDGGPVTPPEAKAIERLYVVTVPNRELDVLLVVDDSRNTIDVQERLSRGMQAMLDALDDGTSPDLHIGTISSDLGVLNVATGDSACTGMGYEGRLVVKERCESLLDGRYIVDREGLDRRSRITNYTGSLDDVVDCLVMMGDSGCGFEQPLESMFAALTGNPANAGFLRETSHLAVVVMADEDDCSAWNPTFFGPETEQLGPLDSFRCFEFGVTCDESDPRAEGARTNCRGQVDSPYLHDVHRYVDFVEQLRPGRVSVASMIGDPAPVEVGRRIPMGTIYEQPDLVPSCLWTDPNGFVTVADPAVRLAQFADGFGERGMTMPWCGRPIDDAMTDFAERIDGRMNGQPCLQGELADSPGCDVSLVAFGEATPFDHCNATGLETPCWRFVVDAASCPTTPSHRRLDVLGVISSPDVRVEATCRVRDESEIE